MNNNDWRVGIIEGFTFVARQEEDGKLIAYSSLHDLTVELYVNPTYLPGGLSNPHVWAELWHEFMFRLVK